MVARRKTSHLLVETCRKHESLRDLVERRPGEPFAAGTPHALFQTTVDASGGLPDYAVTGDGQRFLVLVPVGAAPADTIQVVTDWPGLLTE
jgi:hypothetical protein